MIQRQLTCCLQGRQNCIIYMKSDRYLLKIVCASYNLFYCMNRRAVHIKKLYATSSYNLKGCVNGPLGLFRHYNKLYRTCNIKQIALCEHPYSFVSYNILKLYLSFFELRSVHTAFQVVRTCCIQLFDMYNSSVHTVKQVV